LKATNALNWNSGPYSPECVEKGFSSKFVSTEF